MFRSSDSNSLWVGDPSFHDFRRALVAADDFDSGHVAAPSSATVTAWPGLGLAEAVVCDRRGALRHSEEPGRLDAGRLGRALIQRVAQRELNLAFGAREREALGLLRRTPSSVTTVTCTGLPFSWSCSMRVPAVSTCTLARTTFVVVSAGFLVGLAVASTSTRVPGST